MSLTEWVAATLEPLFFNPPEANSNHAALGQPSRSRTVSLDEQSGIGASRLRASPTNQVCTRAYFMSQTEVPCRLAVDASANDRVV